MAEDNFKEIVTQCIDNLDVIFLKGFMHDRFGKNFNFNIKSRTEEYISSLSQKDLGEFLTALSSHVEQNVDSVAMKGFLDGEWVKNALTDAKSAISSIGSGKKLKSGLKITSEFTKVTSGENIPIDEILGLINKLCEAKEQNFSDCETSVVGNLIDFARELEKKIFKLFEQENYDPKLIDLVLFSKTFLAAMAKIKECKVKSFLLNLNLDDWVGSGKYAELRHAESDNFNFGNLEKEKTLLRYGQVYTIKYVAQMKKILFDKKMDDKEKMQALDGIIKNNEFARINLKSEGGILAAYVDIFKSEFGNIIEENPKLKKAFDKTHDLIKLADNFNVIDKFCAVFLFVFTAIAAVCSLGLIFGVDKLMGSSCSYDVLRSCSPFKSLQKEDFKNLIKKLEKLEKEVSKTANLKENKKEINKGETRN